VCCVSRSSASTHRAPPFAWRHYLYAAMATTLLTAFILCAVLFPFFSRDRGTASAGATQLPRVYSYEVVRELAHDPHAFTQGLQYDVHNGREVFWESTGLYGQSEMREVSTHCLPAERHTVDTVWLLCNSALLCRRVLSMVQARHADCANGHPS
jgi:hypothetical protein